MLTKDETIQLAQITRFWFDHLTPEDWFVQADPVDQQIRDQFSHSYHHFKTRNLTDLDLTGDQILAAIILFDQMPRNMFRDSAKAFATDDLALSLCFMALANQHDLSMTDIRKTFLYLPLEHSEDLNNQALSVSLFQQRTKLAPQIDYAVRHEVIIRRFGRFPHRNSILGRTSTPEEIDYLANGGESFGGHKEPESS